jgi:hypothetical protein
MGTVGGCDYLDGQAYVGSGFAELFLPKGNESVVRKFSINYQYFLFIALGLMAFSLNVMASRDWHAYAWQFRKLTEHSWSSIINSFSLFEEPLFYFSAKFWGEFIGFPLFIALATTLLLCVKLHFLQKLTSRPWIAVYLYLCAYLFLFEGTVLRVAYATALIIPALYFLSREQYWHSLALWFLATQIHFSASVFLLAFALFILSYRGFLVLAFCFVLSPLLIVAEYSLSEQLIRLVAWFRQDYASYGRQVITANQNSSGMFFYYVSFYYGLILLSLCVLWKRFNEDRTLRMIAGLGMTAVIIMSSLYDHVVVAARLGELLLVVSPLMFAETLESWSYSGKKLITVALCGGFTLFAVARFVYLYPALLSI